MTTFYIVMLCVGGTAAIANAVLFARRPSVIGIVGILAGVFVIVMSVLYFAGVTS